MVKALHFKGDKKPKKRKRTEIKTEDSDGEDSKALVQASEDHEDDSWVSAEAVADISGPIMIVLPTQPHTSLACDSNGRVFASEIENMTDDQPATAEPHIVQQVWVANRVAGSETFSFKGHHGMYLSCDKFGVLSATREAISPEESFSCIAVPHTPSALALQTQRDGFLRVDEKKKVGDTSIRGDAEAIEFTSTLRIRMQARFKPKLKVAKEEKAKSKISRKELEDAAGRKLDDEEVKKLKRARRDGDYHEAMLDIKVKSSHDKFA
ncbi:MAG: hypothetical protein M1828_002958 [Chrysothrix sp. TS-e1954]|nr:MAG: hypothetical protein M1828_002958 [Chrysothrix sp. TS-e1954]